MRQTDAEKETGDRRQEPAGKIAAQRRKRGKEIE
jgi:hypothetical protein